MYEEDIKAINEWFEEHTDYGHYTRWLDYDFCPNCGADMRGESE